METVVTHPETGSHLRRGVRPWTYRFQGWEITVDQPGWWPEGEGDGVLDPADLEVSDAALADLKQRFSEKGPGPGSGSGHRSTGAAE